MSSVRESYNAWATQYDSNINATRDLEARALRLMLENIKFDSCLELGCGTGKNTSWLVTKTHRLTAVDISEEMLQKAKEKLDSFSVEFVKANLNEAWDFGSEQFHLLTFSLVLEHIQELPHIFHEASKYLLPGGWIYVGELHPFRQYNGSKARFETENGTHTVECYTHHISDLVKAGKDSGMEIISIEELFDEDDRSGIPRILSMLFRKPA